MLQSATMQTSLCPSCQAPLIANKGYVVWCDQCDWNIDPIAARNQTDSGKFGGFYRALGHRQTEVLYRQVAAEKTALSRHTATSIATLAFAWIIHGLTFATAALGLALIIRAWPHLPAIGLGLLLIAFAWSLRPRITRYPLNMARRGEFPALFALTDQVAADLGIRQVAGIVINGSFNASVYHAGWRQRPILTLGLPLWAILNDRERLALLGHELAHEAHGDLRRGRVVGGALLALESWYISLSPPEVLPEDIGIGAFIAIPLMKGLRLLPHGGLIVLEHLSWRNAQRGEYLADRFATRIAGTEAMIGVLTKLQLDSTMQLTMRHAAYGHDEDGIFDAIRRHVHEVPTRELERIRRAQRSSDARLDRTHPPTAYRLALLESARPQLPANDHQLTLVRSASAEIATLEKPLEQEIKADFFGR